MRDVNFKFRNLLSLVLLFQYDVCAQLVDDECGRNYTDVFQGIVTFDSQDFNVSIHECQWSITGPSGTYVQLSLTTPNVVIEDDDTLQVSDGLLGEIFILKTDPESMSTKNFTVNSLTNSLLIRYATSSNHSSSFVIPFVVQFRSNSSITTYTDPSGTVTSSGSAKELCINYVHTHQIDVGQVNGRIYLYLKELNVDDASGDFVTIGSRQNVLGGSPAMLLTGKRKGLSPIAVESGSAYVFVYARNYTIGSGFTFFYNSTVVLPPTDQPPTTVPPPIPLNATISFDMQRDDIEMIMSWFVDAMKEIALKYCRGDFLNNGTISNLTSLDVFMTEAVYVDPCVTFVFYIVLHDNDTCLDHNLFTVDDFYHMFGNYSSTVDKILGRPILQSCNYDVTVWVLLVVILLFSSLTLTIVVTMTTRSDNLQKSVETELIPGDETVKENPLFGAKVVTKDDNPFVMWSESEKPSSVKKFKSRKKAGLHLKIVGFHNNGFMDDSLTSEKKGVSFATVYDVGCEDRDIDEDVLFDRRKLSEEVSTPLETPLIELSNQVLDDPNDVKNDIDDILDETRL